LSNKGSHSSTSAIEDWPPESSGSAKWRPASGRTLSLGRQLLAAGIVVLSLVGQWLAFAFGAIARDSSGATRFCVAPCSRPVHLGGWTAFLFLPELVLLVFLIASVFVRQPQRTALRWIGIALMPTAVLAVGLVVATHSSVIDALPHGWWFGKWR
jgi:hypothetical protein